MYEYLFPNSVAPNVKLPQGYRDILEGKLMDGAEISDVQLENVRSNLMEELRKDNSPLSIKLDDTSRDAITKVVLITSPEWSSTFKPEDEIVEGKEGFANSDADKLPIPKKNYYMLHKSLVYESLV